MVDAKRTKKSLTSQEKEAGMKHPDMVTEEMKTKIVCVCALAR